MYMYIVHETVYVPITASLLPQLFVNLAVKMVECVMHPGCAGVPEGSRVQYVIRILMSVPSTFTTVPTDEPRASTLLVDTFADAPLDSSIRRVCALVSEPIRLQHYLLS